jgi:hypothetical protein
MQAWKSKWHDIMTNEFAETWKDRMYPIYTKAGIRVKKTPNNTRNTS